MTTKFQLVLSVCKELTYVFFGRGFLFSTSDFDGYMKYL